MRSRLTRLGIDELRAAEALNYATEVESVLEVVPESPATDLLALRFFVATEERIVFYTLFDNVLSALQRDNPFVGEEALITLTFANLQHLGLLFFRFLFGVPVELVVQGLDSDAKHGRRCGLILASAEERGIDVLFLQLIQSHDFVETVNYFVIVAHLRFPLVMKSGGALSWFASVPYPSSNAA